MTAFVQVALSVTEEIKEVGAYAGIAAIVGLAVLALLYFAQARELKRLRDWAGRAPERAAELEARVQAEATKRVVAQPVQPAQPRPAQPATPAAQQQAAAAATAAPTAAATPAGAAAKAATPGNGGATPAQAPPPAGTPAAQPGTPPAATPGPAKEAQPAGKPTPGAQPAAAPAAAAEAKPAAAEAKPAASPGKPADKPPTAQPGAPTPAAPVPGGTPVVAPAASASAPPPVTVKPDHDATDRADSARPYVRPPTPTPEAAPLRAASAPSATLPPRTPAATAARVRREPPADGTDEGSPMRRNLAIVGGVLGMATVLIVLVAVVFSGGGDDPPANTISNEPAITEPTDTTSPTDGGTSTRPPVTRGDVTVAVLNGTTTTGLARAAGNRIQTSGYKLGVVTNAADQQRSATIVSYTPGHRAEGLDVARIVKVGADAVQPIDESTQVVAGQEAVVVVTVGADQNT